MPLKNFLYVLLLLSLPTMAQVKMMKIEGTVINQQTQLPLQGVTITVKHPLRQTATDAKGNYSLRLPTGDFLLLFTLQGYTPHEEVYSINDELTTTLPTVAMLRNDLQEEQLTMIAENELDNDQADVTGALLHSWQDVFTRRAAFDFSTAFFRQRGYDAKDVNVLLNGIPMNRLENGRPLWANWSGLNDLTRNQEVCNGLEKSNHSFGGMNGSNYIGVRASQNRAGIRLTSSVSNRSYAGRLMVTYHSGLLRNGWAYSLSASRRWAANGSWAEGTHYNAYAFGAAVEYQPTAAHSFNFIGLFSPVNRGKTSPLTREVIDLVGYRYNPYWGTQRGVMRNSRNRIVSEPIFVLSYIYEKEDARLNIDLGYQFGEIGNTRISYANATNPEPNYYKLLPSYYINNANGANWAMANEQRNYFLSHSQLDWVALYRANKNTTDGRSSFIVSNDVMKERTFTVNVSYNTTINSHTKFSSGIVYRNIHSGNYALVENLLGGQFFMNYDYFEHTPYNILDKNLRKGVGEKWNYDYNLRSHIAEGFAQWESKLGKLDLFAAVRYFDTQTQREGNFANPSYPDSYGKGSLITQKGISLKAGATYAFTGRQLLQLNAGYFSTPQPLRNLYNNVRNSNGLLPHIKSESAYTADVSYLVRLPKLTGRATAYFTTIENASENNFFYTEAALSDEIDRDFVAQTIQGIQKEHLGIEIGAEAMLLPTVKVSVVAAIGQHIYSNNPSLHITSDGVNKTIDKVWLKNYHLPNGAQQAYAFGAEYRSPKSNWWISATANYLANNYIALSALNRTSQFFIDPATHRPFDNIDRSLARKLLAQESLANVMTINALVGKSWRFKKTYTYLMLSINNLFDRSFLAGGFEQARTANYKKMVQDNAQRTPSFGNRYFIGYGRTYMANLSVTL